MRNKKIEKMMIIITIVGISLFFYRIYNYNEFLGSFLDALWVILFCVTIYDLTSKYLYMLIPPMLGVFIEIFQYTTTVLGLNHGGYYPGYYDIHDIIAYFIGFIFAYILVKVMYNKP